MEEPEREENFPVLLNIVPVNYMTNYLPKKLNIAETLVVGGKVTEVKA